MRFDLLADGSLVWTRTWSFGDNPPTDEWIDLPIAKSIDLICDPLGSCGSDGAAQTIEVYSPDCDGNGIADELDIAAGTPDTNTDGIPDTCQCGTIPSLPACCPGDLNHDAEVGGADIGLLLSNWGPCASACLYDLNNDDKVNGGDLGLLLSGWGPCPN